MGNKFIANLKMRRSIRAYLSKMPSPESIKRISEAGSYAPNGLGKQSATIVVVTEKSLRDRLSKMNAAILGSSVFYLLSCLQVDGTLSSLIGMCVTLILRMLARHYRWNLPRAYKE